MALVAVRLLLPATLSSGFSWNSSKVPDLRISMHHSFVSSMAAICFACTSFSPAWADDPKTTNVQAKSGAWHLVALPKAIAGFCAGVVVGTPICFARKFPQEVSAGGHGLLGSI